LLAELLDPFARPAGTLDDEEVEDIVLEGLMGGGNCVDVMIVVTTPPEPSVGVTVIADPDVGISEGEVVGVADVVAGALLEEEKDDNDDVVSMDEGVEVSGVVVGGIELVVLLGGGGSAVLAVGRSVLAVELGSIELSVGNGASEGDVARPVSVLVVALIDEDIVNCLKTSRLRGGLQARLCE